MAVASYEHESRLERIVFIESRLDCQKRLRVRRHHIDVLDREGRRVEA